MVGHVCGTVVLATCPGGGTGGDSTGIHLFLGGMGALPFVGAIADIADAILYAVEADPGGAALSVASAVPIVGDIGNVAKLGRVGATAIREADEAVDVVRIASGGASVARRNRLAACGPPWRGSRPLT